MNDLSSLPPAHLAELQQVEGIARRAGETLRKACGGDLVINESHLHDIKLELDVETQLLIEGELTRLFPGHHILGEEGGDGNDGVGTEWIVDPIDGTVNLTYGIPHFCVSIARRENGVMQLGVIYDPMRDEMFSGWKGAGAYLNGRRISVSSRTALNEAIVSLGFSKSQEAVAKCLELYQFYGPRTRKIRAMGSAALDMAYIAAGRLDAYIEQGIKIWDIAAGQVLVEEAGGRVDLTPRPERHHYHILASNARIHFPQK
jgi:myo-inositol-1(or 4)-monophosphatase